MSELQIIIEGINDSEDRMESIKKKWYVSCMYTEYWPVSDTTVSTVRELIWSRLNISGVGRGNGTFFKMSSRGVAIAYKIITQE